MSLRLKLTLSYVGFLLVAGLALGTVLVLVLQFVPDANLVVADGGTFAPGRRDLVDVALPLVGIGLGFLAIVGLVGGWFLAGWVLRPLDAITDAARLAAQGSLGHRVRLAGPDDELRRLSDVFDDMLTAIETSFEEQKRFTANASHELRTPLSATKTMLEVARADREGRDVDLLLLRLQELNQRSTATLESLLQLARADRSLERSEICDLVAVVEDALGDVDPTGGPGGRVEVRATLPDAAVPVVGDVGLLSQLVGNLLRNALVHNVSAAGVAWVDVRVDGAGRAVLTVANTGPVVDAAVAPTLLEPFVRGGGRARSVSGGSGLGLAIVASVARAHRAHLVVSARAGGGLEVTAAFPSLP